MVGYETDIFQKIGLSKTPSGFGFAGATTGPPTITVSERISDTLSLASASGEVCFGIEFKDCLPMGLLRDIQTDDFISVKSGGISLGCGEIEYCSGFYKYTLANDTFVQFNRQRNSSYAKVIALLLRTAAEESAVLAIVGASDNLLSAAKALEAYASFVSKGYGIYHFSRRHDSYTAQLWLSNIPDSDNGCLSQINLFKNSTAVANLVLDGVYGGKCNKGNYGSRRYTGSIIGDTIVNATAKSTVGGGALSLPPFSNSENPRSFGNGFANGYVQNKKSFGTISLNISVPQ
jgi:hypothetical protein